VECWINGLVDKWIDVLVDFGSCGFTLGTGLFLIAEERHTTGAVKLCPAEFEESNRERDEA